MNLLTLSSVIYVAILFQGCANTQNNKTLDKKMSQEPTAINREHLQNQVKDFIANDPKLSEGQKEKLMSLRKSTNETLNKLNRKSLELRSVLIKDVMATNYNAKEVALIKSRLRKVENERLTTIFDAVDKSNVILGHQASFHINEMNKLFNDPEYRDHEVHLD